MRRASLGPRYAAFRRSAACLSFETLSDSSMFPPRQRCDDSATALLKKLLIGESSLVGSSFDPALADRSIATRNLLVLDDLCVNVL